MLGRLTLILLAAPAIALAAPPPAGQISVVAPPAAKTAPASTTSSSSSSATPSSSAPYSPAQPIQRWTDQNDASSCRIACANDSYVCRAGDNPDGCDGIWSQCVANCDQPNLGPGFSTTP